MKPTTKPTVLELFAAFAAQLPLLTHEDLKFTVDAMRGSASFRRMLQHAREQAVAIGLSPDKLDQAAETPAAAAATDEEPDAGQHSVYPLPAAG
jgi:hypothetical protein